MPNQLLAALRADHDRILELLEEITVAKGQLPLLRQAALDLEVELASHLGAEERVFVPAILDQPHLKGLPERTLSEHVEIRRRLQELDRDAVGTPGWWRTFRALRDAVQQNVDHEERHLFVEASTLFSDQHWRALLGSYRRSREERIAGDDDHPVVTRDAVRSAWPEGRPSPGRPDSPPPASG